MSITIQYAIHTMTKTTHGERTFPSDAALERWVEQQAARDRQVEILAYAPTTALEGERR